MSAISLRESLAMNLKMRAKVGGMNLEPAKGFTRLVASVLRSNSANYRYCNKAATRIGGDIVRERYTQNQN